MNLAEPLAGYGLADYLEQDLTQPRRLWPIPDGVWDALRTHTTRADDLTTLAGTSVRYSRYQHAEALYRAAVAAGRPHALRCRRLTAAGRDLSATRAR